MSGAGRAMKTADLVGKLLDQWVVKAIGQPSAPFTYALWPESQSFSPKPKGQLATAAC